MSSNTNPVTVPCKYCGQGVVIVKVPTTGSGGTTASSSCPKCGKASSYSFNLNSGTLTKIY